jgi:hypothetical protein
MELRDSWINRYSYLGFHKCPQLPLSHDAQPHPWQLSDPYLRGDALHRGDTRSSDGWIGLDRCVHGRRRALAGGLVLRGAEPMGDRRSHTRRPMLYCTVPLGSPQRRVRCSAACLGEGRRPRAMPPRPGRRLWAVSEWVEREARGELPAGGLPRLEPTLRNWTGISRELSPMAVRSGAHV